MMRQSPVPMIPQRLQNQARIYQHRRVDVGQSLAGALQSKTRNRSNSGKVDPKRRDMMSMVARNRTTSSNT